MLLLLVGAFVVCSGVPLKSSLLSLNSSACFISQCNGQFKVVPVLNVTVGGILLTLGEIMPSTGVAGLSGEVWISWPVCTAFSINGTLLAYRPDLSFILYNANNPLSFATLFDSPDCLSRPGFAYQRWTFTANFDQEMDFRAYPLDTHVIQARFYESVFPTEDYGSGALLYVPERTNTSRYPIALRAAGWQTAVSPSFGLVDVVYVPSERSALELRTYSRVSLQVIVTRGNIVYVFRMLPPLVIVVLSSVAVLLLSLREAGQRVALSMSGLLTIIFMNFTLSFGAPLNVDYLTRLDWLFFCCYILQILLVGHSFIIYLVFVKISAEIAALDKRKRRRLKMDRQALEWHTSANVREKKQFKPFDLKLAKRAEKEKLIKLRKVDVVVMLVMVALGISVFFVVSFVPIINSDLSTAVKLSE